jgi:hypothetical protein
VIPCLLGSTGRRSDLGIRQTQAGRRDSRLGSGQRAGARCSTATSRTDSATSATAPGRSAAGRCRPPRRTWPRPGRSSHRHRTRPPLRPGRGAPAGVGRPSSIIALGRRCELVPVPRGLRRQSSPRWALRPTNYVAARCGLPDRRLDRQG